MSINKILCTADLHIDEKYFNQKNLKEGYVDEFSQTTNGDKFKVESNYPSLLGIIERANADDIDMVVIAGDLYGLNDNHYSTIAERLVLGDFLSRINKNIYIMYGNHETRNDLDIFSKFSNITVINDYLETADFKFLSYQTTLSSESVKKFLSKSNKVLFTHAMFDGAKMGNKEFTLYDNRLVLPAAFKQKPGRIIIAGHVHKPQTINDFVFYTGSTDRLDFGEIEDKSFIVFDFKSNAVERIPLTNLRDLHLYTSTFENGKFNPVLPDTIPGLSKLALTIAEEDMPKIPFGALSSFYKIEYINSKPKERRYRSDNHIIKADTVVDKCSNYLSEKYKDSDIKSILQKVESIISQEGEQNGN